ncbi:MAG: hypothetical protein IRZ32_13415, partial [Solirubrobacteraceae bacterium]|nr:hypothetical protein [Solirubrobacteraceae bacterium]
VELEDGLRELIAWRRAHMEEVAARRDRAAGEQGRVDELAQPASSETGGDEQA